MWTCQKLLDEELHFRRNGTYRFSKISDVIEQIYNKQSYMQPYLNGLLLSQVMWSNHATVFDYYMRHFLPRLANDTRHLEVGPGHGLFLYFAQQSPNISSVTGWDISETSIKETQAALQTLGAHKDNLSLQVTDIMSPPKDAGQFDSIVLSEILEHIEDPHTALKTIKKHLSPKGLLFVNVPINSPAPDHIYLLETPEQSLNLVKDAGYTIIDHGFFTTGNVPLEKAQKNKITISAVIIATL